LGKNEFLSASSYRPDVAYMKLGGEPSGAREVYSFAIKPIGVLTEEGLDQNRLIIQPRAPVYILEDEDNPMEWIVKGLDVIWTKAHIERHEGWRVPVLTLSTTLSREIFAHSPFKALEHMRVSVHPIIA